jgi:hypothetical protein
VTYQVPRHLTDKPAGRLFIPADNAVPSKVSRNFVRKIRQEAMKRGLNVAADQLLTVMEKMKGGDYNGAISYAKEHGFELETLSYHETSGMLSSNWQRMVQSMRVWGTRPEFLNMDKPMDDVRKQSSGPKHKKFESDTPYKN